MNVKNAKDAKQGLLALAKVVENGEVVNNEDLAVLEETEESSTTSIVLWSIGGLLVLGGAGYLGWKAYKKAKEDAGKEDKETEEFLQEFKSLNDSVQKLNQNQETSNKVMADAIKNMSEALKKLNELQLAEVEESKPSKTEEDPKEEQPKKTKVVVINSPEELLKAAEAEAEKLQKKANKLGAGPKKVKAQAEAKAALEKVEEIRKVVEQQKQAKEEDEEE